MIYSVKLKDGDMFFYKGDLYEVQDSKFPCKGCAFYLTKTSACLDLPDCMNLVFVKVED